MAVWQDNLERLLRQKEVLILHGNVRDSAYVRNTGDAAQERAEADAVPGLTPLLRNAGRALGYQRAVFWGVFFDLQGNGHAPLWSLERVEFLQGGQAPEMRTVGSQEREATLLTRWLKEEVCDVSQRTLFVIHYIDKLTPYSQRGTYPREVALLITLVQKIIENIAANNRLILVALQDTMIPIEYYTHSPRVAVLEIPLPDKAERALYFTRPLGSRDLPEKEIDFLANITDGLYVRDLENILRDVIAAQAERVEISHAELRRLVNRYRIGSEEDPWAKLPLTGPPKGLIDSAESWFKERVIGQDDAVAAVVTAIKKARTGVVGLASGQESKPKAVFFFAGPTGVGKTFLAKKLAEYLFDTDEAFVRFDMSEFKEEHSVSKLIGSPPGYVGFEMGGVLTNAVKNRPF